jgi:hypothetical protein
MGKVIDPHGLCTPPLNKVIKIGHLFEWSHTWPVSNASDGTNLFKSPVHIMETFTTDWREVKRANIIHRPNWNQLVFFEGRWTSTGKLLMEVESKKNEDRFGAQMRALARVS